MDTKCALFGAKLQHLDGSIRFFVQKDVFFMVHCE
jgi:hypothetical protein